MKAFLAALLFAISLHAFAADIPSLDDMAGDWMPLTIVTNLPDVHNFNQMMIVNRDLTSFFCNPGGLFSGGSKDPTIQWRAGYPLVKMTLNGVEYPAVDVRWYAYRALRRNQNCGGLSVRTDTRMVNEQRGVLCRIWITNPSNAPKNVAVTLRVPGKLEADGIGVSNTTQNTRATSVVRPSVKPAQVTVEGDTVVWHWQVAIQPNSSTELGYVAGDAPNATAADADKNVAAWAGDFDNQMEAFRAVWEKRWSDAFTPWNTHFSGHLPVLKTPNAALGRNYYMGALTMLILERTQFPISRVFVTSGERGDGTQYYWDAAMQATAWALLEPAGMKAVLRCWLVQSPRGSPHYGLRGTGGVDSKHYDNITGYSANACTMFQATDQYLRVTGDRAFLDEKLENGKTVLDSIDALATDWETLPKGPGGLVNYGNNGKLLETAPQYIECVASVNAQNVWMMREAAKWQLVKGNQTRADQLLAQAVEFLPDVLTLYNSDSGAWNARRMNGAVIPVRHCFDFIYVGNALASDLEPSQKLGMINFAKRELFTKDWMRAMSLKDPDVPRATRPDHSYTGSYDGWIPLTAGAMWRLGDTTDAFDFFCRTADVTREGPFAQAHEFYGPDITSNDAPVRIAMRGHNMKECISGGAFADVVINTFFGYLPSPDGKDLLVDPRTPRPFTGTLQNVSHGAAQYTITATPRGLTLKPQ